MPAPADIVASVPALADEWRVICLHRVNALFEGPGTVVESVVGQLLPNLREPVVVRRTPDALPPAAAAAATLILHDAATLTVQDQQQLLEWLTTDGPRPHVVSSSVQPLFHRVQLGLFAERLYYRLNVIRVQVGR